MSVFYLFNINKFLLVGLQHGDPSYCPLNCNSETLRKPESGFYKIQLHTFMWWGRKKPKKMKTSNYEVKEKKCNSCVILLGLLSRAANIQVTFIEPSSPTVTAFTERPLNLQWPENIRRKWGIVKHCKHLQDCAVCWWEKGENKELTLFLRLQVRVRFLEKEFAKAV